MPKLDLKNADEDYLLYALLLHRKLTLPHLALSLGIPEETAQVQVQHLLTRGLISYLQGAFAVKPIHYPRLCTALRNRNFLVEES
ncbi:MAG: hypothetical protein ACUVRV_11365 [Cyanobacteriota bacterium]